MTPIPVRLAFVVVLIAIAGTGCATTAGTGHKTPSKAEDLAALADYNKRYLKSINDGDIATLSALTSNEHTMIPPGRAPIEGKAANDAANGNAFKNNKFDEHWYPVDSGVSGDLAYERGTYTTDVFPNTGGEKRTVSGNYLRIYRRQADGKWKMIYDTFNSVPAAKAP
jgi:ketosteroid isomerase-like protein